MDENPWLRLPTEPPYVLPEDREVVEEFNRAHDPTHKHFLHVDKLLPEPFVGARDAPVLLLSNNPGFSGDAKKLSRRQGAFFRALMRDNLHHTAADWPFVYLHPAFDEWETWWRPKLRHLIERFDQRVVARCILNVVYFPYPSHRYGHKRLTLPSCAQEYSFGLVRDAVHRNASVILLRSGQGNQRAWLKAVPELNGYAKFYLGSNPQQPYVSPGNCPKFYDTIVEAISAFTNREQGSEVKQ